jgi:hypothetical protein
MEGQILSGSNDDPALDFSVKKDEDDFYVSFAIPFKATPSLTLTPTYTESTVYDVRAGKLLGNLILTSNETDGFKLTALGDNKNTEPQYFSFNAMG